MIRCCCCCCCCCCVQRVCSRSEIAGAVRRAARPLHGAARRLVQREASVARHRLRGRAVRRALRALIRAKRRRIGSGRFHAGADRSATRSLQVFEASSRHYCVAVGFERRRRAGRCVAWRAHQIDSDRRRVRSAVGVVARRCILYYYLYILNKVILLKKSTTTTTKQARISFKNVD
jgi:hypothetical protein